ncbi:MAG: alpha/beta fold hydrolase [Nannocystaceae bacterium]|nr:alpha/beta fold hydrolase [Nannocystaceae bacterium]
MAPRAQAVDPRPIARGDADVGVLLLHGLTGTPHEVHALADALYEAGYAVRAPLLAGHTDLHALERSTWRDWYGSAAEAFERLRSHGQRKVVVLGFSMGSLLTLRLAALRAAEVSAAVAISVPLRFPWWQRRAIVAMAKLRGSRLLRRAVGILPKDGGPDIRVMREVEGSPSLEGFPYPALAEMLALQAEVADLLPHVRVPTLLVHGRYDHTAPVEFSAEVSQAIGSARVEREILPRSFHGVGLDIDREQACAAVVKFVHSLRL